MGMDAVIEMRMILLIGVTSVSAIPGQEQVMLNWTNPDVLLSHINISWSEDSSADILASANTSVGLEPLQPASIMIADLPDETSLTFFITAHYANGGISNPVSHHHGSDGSQS